MANFAIVLTFILVIPFAITHGKVFSKCELAREMFRLGVPKSELPDWVCLARYESGYNTKATHTNSNGTKDWGIFQINDRYWCKPADGRRSSNSCNVACNDLLSDSINQAVSCAVKIKKVQGFKAWYAWRSHCQTNKPSTNECF